MPDSLLITGPPASGKSRAAMARFHAVAGSLLIVPSSTNAEHTRHQLVRAGLAVRPRSVTTFAGFLEDRAPPPPSSALLDFALTRALEQLPATRYAAVAEYRGFREALAQLAQETPAHAVDGELAAILREVEQAVSARGCALRHRRVEAAAKSPAALAPHIVIDGFFSFSRTELNLLLALAARTRLTLTLADWPGSATVREQLIARGFAEQKCDAALRRPAVSAFAAPTLECEVDEIARRVAEENESGRPFREMGIILRQREPYAPALETAFARFGIPARFHFAEPLASHAAVDLIAAAIRALLGGWNYEDLLTLAQRPLAALDPQIEFELRARIPGAGMPPDWIANPPEMLGRLAALDSWRRERLPPEEWAERLETLRTLLPAPGACEDLSRDDLRAWQSAAAALDAFDQTVSETAAIAGEPVSLADFWRRVEAALASAKLRPPDRRHNVVHVIDVYEARQWELPVVFVCGLADGNFPLYARQDPILGDSARRRAGLRTSAEQQAEEAFLFDLAVSRAAEKTILSYPRFNERGDDSIPSPFLDRFAEPCGARRNPRPRRSGSLPPPSPIQDPGLQAQLAKTHRALAPTSIETFLQCPFQFFAAKTLRLRSRPKGPRERLDVLLEGNIIHRALAEVSRAPLLGIAVFDEVFEQECRDAHVPFDYRTEAVRLEMRRNFETFLGDRAVVSGWPSRVEENFSFALNPLLTLRGRIDRMDLGPRKQTLVIDYKYSAAARIHERTSGDQAGNLVQGGLYMLAAERAFGLQPIGMLYCGLRKGVAWDGWHVVIPGMERTGEVVAHDVLEEMTRAASAKASDVFDAIASGRIEAAPADRKKCARCDFAGICRVESMVASTAATA